MGDIEAVEKFYDARARLAQEEHLSYLHPTCVFRIVGTGKLGDFTKLWESKSSIEVAAIELFSKWDLSELRPVTTHECDDTVYVHRRGNVVYRPDGSRLPMEMIDKMTFKDGAIIEYLQFVDTYAVADFSRRQAKVGSENL